MSEDDQQRTEEPTRKRIEDARNKGQVSFSKEVSNFAVLLSLIFFILWILPLLLRKITIALRHIVEYSYDVHLTPANSYQLMQSIIFDVVGIALLPTVLFFFIALVSGFVQNSGLIVFNKLAPKVTNISPIQGFKKIFSINSIVELVKSMLKIVAVSGAVWFVLMNEMDKLKVVYTLEIQSIIKIIYNLLIRILYAILMIYFVIVIFDFSYKKYSFKKSLRMTKQEVKEEFKQTEGSPELKAKLRKLRRELVKKNMMALVPQADVVITNPTHLAVALLYHADNMPSPKVIAKGKGRLAEKIKMLAQKNNVAIIENQPIARALFESTEVDEYIPEKLYRAVAEIISYVYKTAKKQNL